MYARRTSGSACGIVIKDNPTVGRCRQWIDQQALWVAGWLGGRAAFVQLTYGTIIWIPLVVLGIDRGGFLFLYLATSVSLITQVPLAMIGQKAREEAHRAGEAALRHEEAQIQMLRNQADTLTAIVALLNEKR